MSESAVFNLRPRFQPDREAHKEWGSRGAALVRATRRGFKIPPTAAWGISEVKSWLESFPEYQAAITHWRNWDNPAPALKTLQSALLAAPMPEHWELSLGTIKQLLCGGEDWPLILRTSLRRFKSREPTRLDSRTVNGPFSAEVLWSEFLALVAGLFDLEKAREVLITGIDPHDLGLAVVIQPKLKACLSGRCVTGQKGSLEEAVTVSWEGQSHAGAKRSPVPELAPFWGELLQRTRLAERTFRRPVEVQWIWDSEQLWFTDIKPQAKPELKERRPVRHLLVDLDGTLLGAREFSLQMSFISKFLRALKPYGGWIKAIKTLATLQSELKKPSKDLMNDERVTRKFSEVMGWPVAEARDWLRNAIRALFPKLEPYFYPVPGAKQFLDWAYARYPMFLATNPVWEEDIIKLRLKWAGIDSAFFKSITHNSRMRACKPEPQYYSDLLEQEGLKAEDCLLIGDDFKNDLPATRVGIRVFILSKKDEFHALSSLKDEVPAWHGGYSRLKALLEALEPIPRHEA